MEDLFPDKSLVESWLDRSNDVSLSLSEVCRRAGVNRKTIERYKTDIPKAIIYYLRMEKTLSELEKEKV